MQGTDREALRQAVLAVDAVWAQEYSERFSAAVVAELRRAGYRIVRVL